MTELRAADMMAPSDVLGWRTRAIPVAAIGIIGAVAALFLDPPQFFRAYLVGYLLWLGITLGSLAVLCLQYLTVGKWGLLIRRVLEASAKNAWLMAILFLPIVFGMRYLYEWTDTALVAKDEILKHKSVYLNTSFFLVRAVIYFAVWIGLSFILTRLSERQDTAPGDAVRARFLAAPGAILYVLTVSFATFDWVMSLDPHWFSTIYGLIMVAGQLISAMSFTIIMMVALARREPLAAVFDRRSLHDLGKLLFAFVMLWAYFSFSQFLIIWSGNLPEEIPWFVRRMGGSWGPISLFLVIFHFAVPFGLLLSRNLKRDGGKVTAIASMLIVIRVVDLFWNVTPNPPFFSGEHIFHWPMVWMDIAVVLGIGGIWFFMFLANLGRLPLIPVGDPKVAELQEASHGH